MIGKTFTLKDNTRVVIKDKVRTSDIVLHNDYTPHYDLNHPHYVLVYDAYVCEVIKDDNHDRVGQIIMLKPNQLFKTNINI